jgi:hypothetical protein
VSTPVIAAPTQALADLAFGTNTRVADTSRPLAWLSPDEMAIDLDDPTSRCFGDYELVEKIGQGGMGVVYRARQHGLERDVAIKLLSAGPWASEEFVERFRREARSAARMQHPNIVEIYEFGHRDGLNFFSMRLVEGRTLAQRLAADGPLPPLEAARLLRTLAEAMDYAHRLGVLHLDLKPANVLLTATGEPLIADFGLARRIDAGHDGSQEIAGTPSYMAPEQAVLEAHPLSASTDIHGLGAILYETLCGRPPFVAASAQRTLECVVLEIPSAPRRLDRGIPADLDAICMRCLEKDPARRYASAAELADDLRRFIEGQSVMARVAPLPERARRWVRRNRTASVAFMLLVAGALGTGVQAYRAEVARADAEQQKMIATEEAERGARLTALIAQAFPLPKDRPTREAMENAATRVIDWLNSELASQPQQQEDLLMRLLDQLEQSDNPGAAYALLYPMIERLGRTYRRDAAESLIAEGTHRGKLLGAMLLQNSEEVPDWHGRQQALLAELVEAAADDVDVLITALYYCVTEPSPCYAMNPSLRLARLTPENAAPWALALREGDDEKTAHENLLRSAQASTFDDHFRRIMRLHLEGVSRSNVPLPALLRSAAQRLNPDFPVEEVVAHYQAWDMPLPGWRQIFEACKLDRPAISLPPHLSHCLAFARFAAYHGQSLVANMVGSALIRRLLPDSEEAQQARELRRHYEYVLDARDGRTPEQIRASRDELLARDIVTYTEMEAFKRTLDRAGLPRDPPEGWEPEDVSRLMTGEERMLYRERARALADSMAPGGTSGPAPEH